MSIENARQILGFDLDTILTIEAITKRYRQLIKEFHPDKHPGCSDFELQHYHQKTIAINNAYDYLKVNISRVNDCVSSKKDPFDDFQTIFFYSKRSKFDQKVRAIFENAKDSKLKQEIINLYSRVNINNAKNEMELSKALDNFAKGVTLIYRNYETRFRIERGIPNSFKFDIEYQCDVDTFLNSLEEMFKERKRKLVDKIEDIFDASLIDESIKNTKAFNTFINNYYELLWNSRITLSEEQRVFDEINTKVIRIAAYFEPRKKDYLRLKKQISKLPETFENNKYSKEELSNELDNSILCGTFASTSKKIQEVIDMYFTKKRYINNMRRALTLKSKVSLLRLDPNKDKDKIEYILEILEVAQKVLDDAEKGKYTVPQISILQDLSLSDIRKDELLLAIFTREEYNVFLSFNKDNTRKLDPFVLGNPEIDQYLSLSDYGMRMNINSKEEISKDVRLMPLSLFVKYGNVVNATSRRKNSYETILCQYNGYELVYVHEYKTNYSYYYLREATVNYCNSGNREELLRTLEEEASSMFAEHIDRISKSDKLARTLQVKSR